MINGNGDETDWTIMRDYWISWNGYIIGSDVMFYNVLHLIEINSWYTIMKIKSLKGICININLF